MPNEEKNLNSVEKWQRKTNENFDEEIVKPKYFYVYTYYKNYSEKKNIFIPKVTPLTPKNREL